MIVTKFFMRNKQIASSSDTRSAALHAATSKGSIPIFGLLQQQDPKDNPLCKWVSRREDTQIWVIPLLTPTVGLSYRYSVGGYRYYVEELFWVWVPQ